MMIDEIRARLGLSATDSVRRVGEDRVPAGDVALGRAEPDRPVADIMAQLRESFVLLDLDARLPATCKRLDLDPRLLVIETAPAQVVHGSTFELDDELILLDTRTEAGFVQWMADDGEWIAGFRHGDGEIFAIDREAPPSVDAFHRGEVPPMPVLDEPPVAAIVGDEVVDEWLAAAIEARRSSPSLIDRVAAAGIVRRLWSPPPGGAAALIERVLAGYVTPAARVDAWACALAPELVVEIEEIAIRAAGGLEDELAALADVHAAHPDLLGPAVLAIAHRRDDLQSVLVILQAVRAGEALVLALASVDRVAELAATVLAASPRQVDDQHLAAVSWTDPEAWWGQGVLE